MVLIDRAPPNARHDCVLLDNSKAMATLVEHLVERGYRRIAGVFGKASSTGDERRNGYLESMRRHGLSPKFQRVAPTVEAAHATVRGLLNGDERPDALVVSNSLLLMGAFQAVREARLAIPRDLALAGFDNESWTGLVDPGITVIEQPVEEIGRAAMSLLFERLKSPELSTRKLVLSGRAVLRGSTAARVK